MDKEAQKQIDALEKRLNNVTQELNHVQREQRASKPYFDEWTGRMSDGSNFDYSQIY